MLILDFRNKRDPFSFVDIKNGHSKTQGVKKRVLQTLKGDSMAQNISDIVVVSQPARSPDLNLLDFFFFGGGHFLPPNPSQRDGF